MCLYAEMRFIMAKIFYPDFFNDVFGPIMQPGSSGGFAGPSRIGYVASHLVDRVTRATFSFNPSDKGHFQTLGNFMTDRGYLGGVQGFLPEDVRLFSAHELARENGVSYEFRVAEKENGYKGITVAVEGNQTEGGYLIAASVGGGMIRVFNINGFEINWQSDTFGTLVEGEKELLTEQIRSFEKEHGSVIIEHYDAPAKDAASNNGRKAVFIESTQAFEKELLEKAFPEQKIVSLPAVLPVVTVKEKKPQLFQTIPEWRDYAEKNHITFVQAAIEYEKAASGWSDERIWAYFEKIADIFDKQIHSLEERNYDVADTPILPVYGKNWKRYREKQQPLSDTLTQHILTHALAVNAKVPGVLIVPGPMGTGGGYLYSALDAVREERGYTHEKEIEGLVIAAALGAIAYTHTNASGERGCIGESGVCCAMASGAVTWMAGGDGVMVEHAASMALQANMGLQCDPIPGGLEFPCITRTVRAAVTAPLYAEMALMGIDPLVPYHECLQAIERNYQTVPGKFLCGGECGINCTPTAAKCKNFLTDLMADCLKYEATV
jgi:L-serine dehydratase